MTGPTRAPATLAADLAGLSEQATPGPWRFTDSEVVDDVWEAGLTVVSADGDAIANVADQWYEDDPGEPAPVNDVAYIVALVNAHRAEHLVTLDAALDWVAEQLVDLGLVQYLMDWVPLCMLPNHPGPAPQYDNIAEAASELLAAALAALRDRAASPAEEAR